jgi:hypothetical protein
MHAPRGRASPAEIIAKPVGCNLRNRVDLDFLPIFGTFDKRLKK